ARRALRGRVGCARLRLELCEGDRPLGQERPHPRRLPPRAEGPVQGRPLRGSPRASGRGGRGDPPILRSRRRTVRLPGGEEPAPAWLVDSPGRPAKAALAARRAACGFRRALAVRDVERLAAPALQRTWRRTAARARLRATGDVPARSRPAQ